MGSGSGYLSVLRYPGALAFTGSGVLARLELAMGSLGLVLLVTGTGGSFSTATVLTGSQALAMAVANPLVSRLVDRQGQSGVLRAQVAAYLPATLLLVLGVRLGAPLPVLVPCAVVSGVSRPMVTALVRARWSWILRGTPRVRTAFAWESMLDAGVIALGAPLATLLVVTVFPAAAAVVAVAALTVGAILLSVQVSTEPEPHPAARLRPGVAFPAGVATMAGISFFVGIDVGAFDIAAVARATESGRPQLAGWVLAVYALGSTLGGLIAGLVGRTGSPTRQYVVVLGLLALGVVPMALVGPPALVVVAALAGAFVAPSVITGMSLTEALAPAGRLTESMAVVATGSAVGRATGQILAGRIVDTLGAVAAFLLTGAAAAAACVLAATSRRHLGRLVPGWSIPPPYVADEPGAGERAVACP